eukprot:g35914.t1
MQQATEFVLANSSGTAKRMKENLTIASQYLAEMQQSLLQLLSSREIGPKVELYNLLHAEVQADSKDVLTKVTKIHSSRRNFQNVGKHLQSSESRVSVQV